MSFKKHLKARVYAYGLALAVLLSVVGFSLFLMSSIATI